jgi:hypothetical protein
MRGRWGSPHICVTSGSIWIQIQRVTNVFPNYREIWVLLIDLIVSNQKKFGFEGHSVLSGCHRRRPIRPFRFASTLPLAWRALPASKKPMSTNWLTRVHVRSPYRSTSDISTSRAVCWSPLCCCLGIRPSLLCQFPPLLPGALVAFAPPHWPVLVLLHRRLGPPDSPPASGPRSPPCLSEPQPPSVDSCCLFPLPPARDLRGRLHSGHGWPFRIRWPGRMEARSGPSETCETDSRCLRAVARRHLLPPERRDMLYHEEGKKCELIMPVIGEKWREKAPVRS